MPDKPVNTRRIGVFGLVVPELEAAFGFRVLAAYGMTETVTHCIHTTVKGEHNPPRSMGKPTPGYEFLIINPETGALCADGSVGELWVRGVRAAAFPGVFRQRRGQRQELHRRRMVHDR